MSVEPPIRILLADDHSKVHRSIAAVIDFIEGMELVAQASDGHEAIQLSREFQPDIVLMDVVMPHLNGIEATRHLRREFPAIKVVALSSFQDEESVREMLEAGAVGYLVKNSSIDDLASTLRAVYAGKSVISPEVIQILLQQPPAGSAQSEYHLTERELQVLKLMVAGQTNHEIAISLTISLSTIKFHVSSILSKLKVSSRTEAVALAVTQHLVN